jgi:hypothetical protein
MAFLSDLPLFVTGPALVLALVSIALTGLGWFRKHQLPRLRFGEKDADFGAAIVASIMVFYGLAAALMAVHVWEAYEHIKSVTKEEASSIAVLYRDVSGYPEPVRGELRRDLAEYTDQIIHRAWPLQRRGELPTEGVKMMDAFQTRLMSFEPETEGQRLLAHETLASYSRMIEARRLRIDSVDRHLPGVLWLVLVLGALISLVSTYYFPVLDIRVHRAQVALLATFIALVLFMILALDRPFRGDLGLKPQPYEIVYKQLMSE